ncbi:MAG: hypothetical protein A2Z17_00740 [Gammaproteobacteria bacterium RBG_16_66_13]|nr:MAG: hypothetical protein A2Z17_00740 [Gammaproteobacteria bacterium RBG_16_66_13]
MRHPFRWAIVFLVLAVVVSAVAPPERVLGQTIGLVYLHGAWVWTAIIVLGASAVTGWIGWLRRPNPLANWSMALGQVGTFFWVSYLPLSLWAMDATWGGLFLVEPRWRLGVNLALVSLLAQTTILLIRRPDWASAVNVVVFLALVISLMSTSSILHPSSPVFDSGSLWIVAAYLAIQVLCLASAGQLAYALSRQRQ